MVSKVKIGLAVRAGVEKKPGMSVRRIVQYPEEVLRLRARRVEHIDDRIRDLVRDMAETMYAAPGLGLAAPQVGESLQVMVIDVSQQDEDPQKNLITVVNPELVSAEGEVDSKEGCLSVVDITCEIKRHSRVCLRGMSLEGAPLEMDADGLLAIVVQHELDHLNGTLIIDRLRGLKRDLMKRRLRKRTGH
ncbi:MAG: peptide deformylase [Pseudomonadota bacterium]